MGILLEQSRAEERVLTNTGNSVYTGRSITTGRARGAQEPQHFGSGWHRSQEYSLNPGLNQLLVLTYT